MLNEYKEILPDLKASNPHFAAIFEKHNLLDAQIDNIDAGREHMEGQDFDKLKKEKLKLKDEAYTMIIDYKKENNL